LGSTPTAEHQRMRRLSRHRWYLVNVSQTACQGGLYHKKCARLLLHYFPYTTGNHGQDLPNADTPDIDRARTSWRSSKRSRASGETRS
jgi:hypothetical protein